MNFNRSIKNIGKMELKDGIKTFWAKNQAEWREWLAQNHAIEKSIWLIMYKKESGVASINYQEALDEALCFGWIDSKPNKRDEQSFYQFFAKRNPKSNWSKVNKDKVAKLIAEGKMMPAGLEMIEIAQKNGTWTALDEVENLILPDDLQMAFQANVTAFEYWGKFPRSVKRGILEWVLNAKKAETRQKRIEETVSLAAQNIRAQFRQ
jgi:uncharacterized protein YdeI (YjbR/CyaY-like superfamily)